MPSTSVEGDPKTCDKNIFAMHASFVSLGQLIKFAYDATGVLPRKRSRGTGLDDKDIKRIHKQLERLIDEEGGLTDRCGELIQALTFELTRTIHNPKVIHTVVETMIDLLEVYRAVVRDDGTYLSPRDSLRWFCGAYAIRRLVLSIHKHMLRFNVVAEGLMHPIPHNSYRMNHPHFSNPSDEATDSRKALP